MDAFINNYFENLKNVVENLDKNAIKKFIKILRKAREDENQIFVMGNGGSASTASHFLCDISKGTHKDSKKRFKINCLNDNIPIMLAYSNDFGYDEIFVEQLKAHLTKDDIVVAISGSGNSTNILKAVEYANSINATTVGFTGFSGGKLKEIAKLSLNANINDMQITEDTHVILTHLIMQILERGIF